MMWPTQADYSLKLAIEMHDAYIHSPSLENLPLLQESIRLYEAAMTLYTEEEFPVQWAGVQSNLAKALIILPSQERPASLERAIAACEAALKVYTEDEFPIAWAEAQNNLGNALLDLRTDGRAARLDRAIAAHRAALRVCTKEAYPKEWAETQNNLGIAYAEKAAGDEEVLAQAIAAFKAALQVRTERDSPSDWAATQINLGSALARSSRPDHTLNVKQAIACFEAALRVYTEHDFACEWALAQNNLGLAWAEFAEGDRHANLGLAIGAYEAALRVYTQGDCRVEWAATQNNLGVACAELYAIDRSVNPQRAITAYRAALEVRTERDLPIDWAATQSNLGLAYAEVETADFGAYVESAICCFQNALRVYTQETLPREWARTQSNLGNAYARSPRKNRTETLNLAIAAFQSALRVYTEDRYASERAMNQNSLGNAFAQLPTARRGQNLKEAISAYQAALRIYTESDFPADWAMVQSNLGAAYTRLPTEDRSVNLRRAIAAQEAALRIYTKEKYPHEWAMTQNNLGAAWAQLPGSEPGKNLEHAITAYNAALNVFTEVNFPVNWAMTENNLGSAYLQLREGNHAANLDLAIAAYEKALCVYTEERYPVDWAMTQNNLGNAYADLAADQSGTGLERAIECYEAALRVRTAEDFPVDWATTKNNLGNACSRLPAGHPKADPSFAIDCYQAALRVRTPDQLPADCHQTLNNLAALLFDRQAWDQALVHYEMLVDVAERIRMTALEDVSRRRVLEQTWLGFERGALCALRTRQYTRALALVERGKTRNLADHLWQRETRPRSVSARDWKEYQDNLAEARELEQSLAEPASASTSERPSDYGLIVPSNDLLAQLGLVRTRSRELEKLFAMRDPDYVPFAPPLAVENCAELAKANRAVIVDFRVTSAGTYAFLLGPADRDVSSRQVVEIDDFPAATLRQVVVDWLLHYLERRDSWPLHVEDTTRELYRRLLAPVHQRLLDLYPAAKRLVLVPNLWLNLLPLHAGWWQKRSGPRQYLLDDYEISYAPSCQVLKRSLARELLNPGPARTLFAVQNPDVSMPDSLPFSDWEVMKISEVFPEHARLVLEGARANKKGVLESIVFGEEQLFSCHGVHDLEKVERSHLRLAGGEKLTTQDVMRLDLSGAKLVIMSACESAMTDFRDIIDEYQGLPAAFLIAGAQSVIGSLWAVDDFATALLMDRLHFNLYERESPMAKAEALRDAQRWLRDLTADEVDELRRLSIERISAARPGSRTGTRFESRHPSDDVRRVFSSGQHEDGQFSNPYYWAAFQCIGTGWLDGTS
jgi:CHAT domain-containing protein/tetratricopeptide (TPR) repeat protein